MNHSPNARWTARQSGLVLLVLIVGNLLALFQPVWVAPPNIGLTFYVYSGLAMLWIPVLIGLLIAHRERAALPVILLVGGAILVMFIMFAYSGGKFLGTTDIKTCSQHEVAPGQTEYDCLEAGQFWNMHQDWVLRGPAGFPFASVVSASGYLMNNSP